MTLFRSLSVRPFALLLAGQTLSRVGDYLYQLVLAWWVLERTGSALAMSSVLIVTVVPELIFGLIGGVAVDRFPRVPIMLASDLLRGILVAGATVLAYNDALQIWHIYAISLLFGTVDAFFQPAYTALVPSLVHPDDLPSANSLSSMSHQVGRITGPPLAAAIITLGGTSLGFLVNGLSFFLSTIFLLPLLAMAIPAPAPVEDGSGMPRSFRRDLREGFAVIARKPILWTNILVTAFSNVLLTGPYSVAMPFLIEESLNADVEVLGLLYALFPIGYVLSGVWLGRKTTIHRRGLLLFIGLAVAGLGLFVFGLPLPLAILGLAAIMNGAALEASALAGINLIQELVPGEKLGRVASIDMLGTTVLFPLGLALTGLVVETLGPPAAFLLGGGLTILLALLPLLHPTIRRFD